MKVPGMHGLESTIDKLISSRRQWESLITRGLTGAPSDENALDEVTSFGTNPGDLRMLVHVPPDLSPGAPLVVVLHGCTQTAGGYDAGTGWSTLADRHGFALLLPEQKRSNNPHLCFNWFNPEDVRRDQGEVGSIRQMVGYMLQAHHLDRRRVFVTGLSAGGAMTAALLATYPDVFSAGAIIAGLPYGCATTPQEALDCMFNERSLPPRALGDLVRAAAPPGYIGPWPQVTVWHGGADTTVKPVNAIETIKQWTDVHGLPADPSSEDTVDGCSHKVWRGPHGAPLVSLYTVPGMGHGTPIDSARNGAAAPHILDVGVPSTLLIAKAWGLLGTPAGKRAQPRPPVKLDPAAVITRALRSVGLIKR